MGSLLELGEKPVDEALHGQVADDALHGFSAEVSLTRRAFCGDSLAASLLCEVARDAYFTVGAHALVNRVGIPVHTLTYVAKDVRKQISFGRETFSCRWNFLPKKIASFVHVNSLCE